jgi:hypothetical protein
MTHKECVLLWQPKMNIYYVAAKETMTEGLLPRIMAGTITVERTWRAKGVDVTEKRDVNQMIQNIKIALRMDG